MLAREADAGLGPLLGQSSFPAELAQKGSKNPGAGQAERMRDLLGQGTRCLAPLSRLVRIAQMPQDPGRMREAKDPRLRAVEEHMRVMALSVIQAQALLQVRLGRAELTQRE